MTFVYPEAETKPDAKRCCLFTTIVMHEQDKEAVSHYVSVEIEMATSMFDEGKM